MPRDIWRGKIGVNDHPIATRKQRNERRTWCQTRKNNEGLD